jgi:hypothetical protein
MIFPDTTARTIVAKTPSPQPIENEAPAAAPTKGHATPTRKEREAARKQPLVPTDRRLAARQSRTQTASARDRARIGMANGEEKYLPAKDKGPQKRYVRDYVDARWSVGELLLPVMVLIFAILLVQGPIQAYGTIVAYAIFLVVIVDVVVLGFQLQRKLDAKFGKGRVEKFRLYAAMRAIQLRPMRLPKPQVKRGAFPS